MIKGMLIGESIRVGAELQGVSLVVRKVRRILNGAPEQPPEWTLIEFEVDEEDTEALTSALAAVLDDRVPWYCDFHTPRESFVVFPGRVFRYQRGNRSGRAEAESYARSLGVPDSRLDWPD
jgi:hypothetical protein